MTDIMMLLCVGLVAGVLSGMVGIGGGIVIVPALAYFLGMTQHTAQGTTLVMFLLPIGFMGVYNYYQAGHIDAKVVKYALIIATTFVVGSFLGSKFAIGLKPETLKRVFGFIILLVSLKMIFNK